MMMMMRGRAGFRLAMMVGTMALGALPTGAMAATIVSYTGRAVFDAAVGTSQIETFDSRAENTVANSIDFGAFTLTYQRTAGTPLNSYFSRGANSLGGSIGVFGQTYSDSLRGWYSSYVIEFDEEVTSFGANFRSGSLGQVAFSLLDTTITSGNLAETGDLFFGVQSDTAFKRIEFRAPGSASFGFDNVTYASAAAAVPEPVTWAMMVVGFGAIGASLRGRRRTIAHGMVGAN
ncbi:PEPxxWA-CTERM sorting domain-containing protein [Sphingomonas sp.]|uniref:PEPxxWA-CTERM sorting domain-containing protein n=1 Tax=Sphingomonas sp. TaxID=28214 RepID=UPI0025D03C5B|nr:PEPxxWA-CTERM sorting domain-containing protein [Sphingomonas sp.]